MPNKRAIAERLSDIIEAGSQVAADVAGLSYDEFTASSQVQRAVLFSLIVVGEAANGLPSQLIEEHPELPWSKVIGFRHRVVHGYFRIDTLTVWQVATQHLPPLVSQVRRILQSQ